MTRTLKLAAALALAAALLAVWAFGAGAATCTTCDPGDPVETAPTASFNWSPASPETGQAVTFTSTSRAGSATIKTYSWDLNGDNTYGDATGQSATTSFATTGGKTVRLKVTDNNDLTDTVTNTVTVVAPPPPTDASIRRMANGVYCFCRVYELDGGTRRANNISIFNGADNQVHVRDTAANITINNGGPGGLTGCTQVAPNEVSCPVNAQGGGYLDVWTNDLDDVVTPTSGPGTVRFYGGDGNDTFNGTGYGGGASGEGGNGDDVMNAGPGTIPSFDGGGGNDTLTAPGSGWLVGGDGNDRLDARPGNGNAGFGGDNMDGGPGNDTIFGGDSFEGLVGGDGSDALDAGGGDDKVNGGAGADSLVGGGGSDAVSYRGTTARVEVRLDGLQNDGVAGEGDNIAGDIESIVGGSGNDLLVGNDGPNSLRGGPGDDELQGLGGNDDLGGANDYVGKEPEGNDTLYGGAGNDTLRGDVNPMMSSEAQPAGNDVLWGGADSDTLIGELGADNLQGEGGADNLNGGGDGDTLDGGSENDALTGGDGADNIQGGAGDDSVSAGTGADTAGGGPGVDTVDGGDDGDSLTGGDGNDTLRGGAGADTLAGENDDDLLDGGAANDTLNGGAGSDTVDYSSRSAFVTVTLNNLAGDGDSSIGESDNALDDENVKGGAGNDVIEGNAAPNRLEGGAGSDTLRGFASDDTLVSRDGVKDAEVNCGDGTGDSAQADRADLGQLSNPPSIVTNCESVDNGNTPPTPAITGPASGSKGQALTFDSSASGDDNLPLQSRAWELDGTSDFNDGTGPTVTRAYPTSGVKTVQLRVTDSDGVSRIASRTVTIVNHAPVAAIAPVANPLSGQAVTFDSAGSTDPDPGETAGLTRRWDLDNDGGWDSGETGTTATRSFATPGPRTVRLEVKDGEGAVNVATVSFTVQNRGPVARIVQTPAAPRPNQIVNLSAETSGDPDGTIAAVDWDLDNDGQFDDSDDPVATQAYELPGTYTVRVQVTDDKGATDATARQIVVADPPPPVVQQQQQGSAGGGGVPGDGGGPEPQPARDSSPPAISLKVGKQRLAAVLKKGLSAGATTSEPGTLRIELLLDARTARTLRLAKSKRPVTIGAGTLQANAPGALKLRAKLTAKARKALRKRRSVRLVVRLTATDGAGNATVVSRTVKLKR